MQRTFMVEITLVGDIPLFLEEVEDLIKNQMGGELSDDGELFCGAVAIIDWTEETNDGN